MKRLVTSLGSYLTSDETADALLGYAQILADCHSSEVVEVPVLLDGGRRHLRLSIGWLIPLHAVDVDSAEDGRLDGEALDALRARIAHRSASSPASQPFEPFEIATMNGLDYD
jgi:hypothetical protein